MVLQPPRGVNDLMPEAMARHRKVIENARRISSYWGFAEMATPIFEVAEVFSRPLGESSDIVSKEMYTFTNSKGEQFNLRPEGTAGVVRALISAGLTQTLPQKFFYSGAMFRYERPQKGRTRQFHQLGVEVLGASDPLADAETIHLAATILDFLGVLEKCKLHLNSLGDTASRTAYKKVLVDYLKDHAKDLSEDSQRRLSSNPLRVLDSKDAGDREILKQAPEMGQYLNGASIEHFERVCTLLRALGVACTLDRKLVRGLDYYCHTAFEFITDSLGTQGTVLGGGRYDGLAEMLGGPAIAGVGWAAGIERLALLIEPSQPLPQPLILIALGEKHEVRMAEIAAKLRECSIRVEVLYGGGSRDKQMKRAHRRGARYVAISGEKESADGEICVYDMKKNRQCNIQFVEASYELYNLLRQSKTDFWKRNHES